MFFFLFLLSTVMDHNLSQYQLHLLLSNAYTGSPSFSQWTSWEQDSADHLLMDKSTSPIWPLVASVVGQVLNHHLLCGLSGNFTKREYGPFLNVKYKLQLGKPENMPFMEDYNKALVKLAKLQAQGSSMPDKHNLIVVDGLCKNLRFMHNVCEKSVCGDVMLVIVCCSHGECPSKVQKNPHLTKIYLEDLQECWTEGENSCYRVHHSDAVVFTFGGRGKSCSRTG